MKDNYSLDMDDDDLESDDSSKDTRNQNDINEASFSTESIVNYGKEYEKLEKIYSKNEIASFNKILELKKINKLNGELDFYKKERIDWKYVYNNIFKKILLPINLNKIDINKTINIHEISQRIKYCVHCISSMKDKNINNEKKNLIPKIIDIFVWDDNKLKNFSNQLNHNNFKINDFKRSNSFENLIFENKNENNKEKKSNLNNKNNIKAIVNDKNSNNKNNNIKNNNIENENNNYKIRKHKSHATINLGLKSYEKFLSKNFLINNNEGIKSKNKFFSSPNKIKTNNKLILNNIEKKNYAYDNLIKNIPKLYDDILFETKQKKNKINLKREAFMETMNDFNSKNLNMEIKDKTFCENFYFFPIKQIYDKENDLENRGEKILSYKKMTDNLMDLLNI